MRGKVRMAALTTMLGATLVFANGCSTVSLPSGTTSVPGQAPARLPDTVGQKRDKSAPNAKEVAAEVTWKKAQPSAAASSDSWDRLNNPVQPAGHKAFPIVKQEPAPLPELMPREKAEPPVQPVALRHGPRVANKAIPPMPVGAPNEASPVVLPTYRLRPPDVLVIESRKGLTTQPILGQHLVRPDGTVGLGAYPPAMVAGLTVEEARAEIARSIHSKMAKEPYEIEDPPKSGKFIKIKPPTEQEVRENLSVDVLAYNSSVYYVITDGAGLGEQVYRFPMTGSETVLDAISHINGLPLVSSPRRIWVARRNDAPGGNDSQLPVDWKGITQQGAMATNWQVMPGDRIYVQADPVRRFNNNLGKFLEPIERVIGATLLSGQTINTLRNGTTVVR